MSMSPSSSTQAARSSGPDNEGVRRRSCDDPAILPPGGREQRTLFILYVSLSLPAHTLQYRTPQSWQISVSTCKPQSVVHMTDRYLLCAAFSVKYILWRVHIDGRFVYLAGTGSGWMVSHTRIMYGPLANGVIATAFKSTPM